MTAADGSFGFSLPQGAWTLDFSIFGYVDATQNVTVGGLGPDGEDLTNDLTFADGKASLTFRPFEIKTLRLQGTVGVSAPGAAACTRSPSVCSSQKATGRSRILGRLRANARART